MPKRKPIDPRSAEPVLRYTGGPMPHDTPARDLHGGDLARIHHVRSLMKSAGERRPDLATAEELLALALELVALGLFVLIEEGEEPTVTKLKIESKVSDLGPGAPYTVGEHGPEMITLPEPGLIPPAEPERTDYTPADLDGHDDPDEDAINPPPEEPAPPAEPEA
jgi:hypothetical protein